MPAVSFTLLIAMAPAPPEIVDAVEEIEIESSTETASAFRLRLGIAQTGTGDWSILQLDLFRPLTPVSIRISNALGVPEAIINGYVSNQQIVYSDQPGTSYLEITGMDATVLMNLQEKVMLWPNLPDSAIAAAIFGQYALIPRIQPTTPQLVEPEGSTTQRGTDIRFLKRLAQRNGFECYVQPEPLSGVDMGYFQPPQLTGLPAAVLNVNMGENTNVLGFQVAYDMLRPTTVAASGIDASSKAPQPALAPVAAQAPMGVEPSGLRITPPPVVRPVDTGLMRTGELQSLAQSIVDQSSFAITAEGEVGPDIGILRPGGLVNVRGLGTVFNGAYYLSHVSHLLTRDSYTQRFRARRNAVRMTGAELFVEI